MSDRDFSEISYRLLGALKNEYLKMSPHKPDRAEWEWSELIHRFRDAIPEGATFVDVVGMESTLVQIEHPDDKLVERFVCMTANMEMPDGTPITVRVE